MIAERPSIYRLCAVVFAVVLLARVGAATPEVGDPSKGVAISGTFAPKGPPVREPVKIAAGSGCVVELVQPYVISGDLAGTMTIDYRIMIYGPCGSPPGTFDETWVAHGRLSVTRDGEEISTSLSYVAHVKAGGDVEGQIRLGHELEGTLNVSGNFADGKLGYAGWLK